MIVALVPAAGQSRRMGRPKLTLPIEGVPLIVRVVSALREGGAESVLVVAPIREEAGAVELVAAARTVPGVEAVHLPSPTRDMRATIQWGLDRLEGGGPGADQPPITTVLVAPGDCVGLTAESVARVVDRARTVPGRIVVPTVGEKRGHPLALPWTTLNAIRLLPADSGLNALLTARDDLVDTVELGDPASLADIDTPDEYRAWAGGSIG